MDDEKKIESTPDQQQVPIDSIPKLPHLRPRVQKFCEAILNGNTHPKARKIAGYNDKNENTAAVQASKLLREGNVKSYMKLREAELLEKMKQQGYATREWCASQLITNAALSLSAGKYREHTAAVAELNRMQGYCAPIKTENINTNQQATFDPSKLPLDVIVEFTNLIKKVELMNAKKEPVLETTTA